MTSVAVFLLLAAPIHAYPVPGVSMSFEPIIYHYADVYLVPRWWAMATAREESDFYPRAQSKKRVKMGRHWTTVPSSRGLFQINKDHQAEHARNAGVKNFHWWNPHQSARVGIALMAKLRKRYHGDLMLASASYNAGSGRIEGPREIPGETIGYLGRIFK